jgi:hypothetical protein
LDNVLSRFYVELRNKKRGNFINTLWVQ